MKKLVILFLALATISTVFATAPTAPSCTKESYPDLYDGDYSFGETLLNGDTVEYVTMTVPFSKITYIKNAGPYMIAHPVPGNECIETASIVADTDSEGIRDLVEMCQKYPNAIAKCSVGIKLTYINGVTDGKWTVSSTGMPINPERL